MHKFVNTYFPNIDNSVYQPLHKCIIGNILKYLCEYIDTHKVCCFKFDNHIEGEFKEIQESGLPAIICNYRHGLKHGEFKSWYRNGQVCERRFYINGEMSGEYVAWCSSGNLLERCDYKNNDRNGARVEWYINNLRLISHYKSGKLHGDYQQWDYNGQLIRHCIYKDGIITTDLYSALS